MKEQAKTMSTMKIQFLDSVQRLVGSLLLFVGIMACQSLDPESRDKEANIRKLIDTNIDYAQKQIDEGKPEYALQTLRPILKSYPDKPLLLNMVGLSYLALSHPKQAQKFFKKAYKLEPNPIYALNLSSALIATENYQEAQEVLETPMREKNYQYIERLYHNYALTLEKRKRYQEAVEFYRKALDENPSYYLSNLRLGIVYKIMKQTKLSEEAFERAVHSCQTCIDPLEELCMIYIKSGQLAKATELLQQFLANKDVPKEGKEQANKLLSMAKKKEP